MIRSTAMIVFLALVAGCAAPAVVPPGARPHVVPLAVGGPSTRAWEPSLAVDPRDARHVVIGNAEFEASAPGVATSWLVSHVTFDGGATWKHARLPAVGNANALGDAFVTFLKDGTPLFAGLAFDNAGTGARADAFAFGRTAYSFFVTRSSDGGATWDPPTIVREGQGVLVVGITPVNETGAGAAWDANDKEWIAVAPDGTLLATWARLLIAHPPEEPQDRQDIVSSISKDGGRTWSAPLLVDKGGQWLGAAPVVTPDGAMHVAYVDLFSYETRVATSRDDGASWKVTSVTTSAFFPSLTRVGERLVLFTADPLEESANLIAQDAKKQRPVVRWSDDGGATWSAPLVVDTPEAGGRTTPRAAGERLAWFHATSDGAILESARLANGTLAFTGPIERIDQPAQLLGDYFGLDGDYAAWVHDSGRSTFALTAARLSPDWPSR